MTKDNKRKLDSTPTSSSEDTDNFELDNISDEVLNVEFDFFEFSEGDFHPIKQFLLSVFDGEKPSVPCSELADWILYSSIGSTVKCDGETGDPYAFISLLGLNGAEWKDHPLSTQVKDWLLRHSPNQVHDLLQQTSGQVGLVLNERLINMPWFVSAPLLQLLLDELRSNAEDAYKFKHLILLFPLYTEDEKEEEEEEEEKNKDGPEAKKGKFSPQKKKKSSKAFQPAYLYHEAEYLERFAELIFDFKNESKGRKRKGMVFKLDELEKAVATLQKMVDTSTYVLSQSRM